MNPIRTKTTEEPKPLAKTIKYSISYKLGISYSYSLLKFFWTSFAAVIVQLIVLLAEVVWVLQWFLFFLISEQGLFKKSIVNEFFQTCPIPLSLSQFLPDMFDPCIYSIHNF